MIVGYARVSSRGQELTVQFERLQVAHCERIFQEKRSGRQDDRPELRACLALLTEGDTLVITRLDRLARSTLHLCRLAAELEQRGAHLQVLDQPIDTRTPTGRLVYGILAVIAQFETELRAERQWEGITTAKRHGVHFGRKDALTPAQADELRTLRAQGKTLKELMYRYGIKKTTIYRYLAQARMVEAEAAD